jgi:hypothetical protein
VQDPNLARTLALLEADHAAGMTIDSLREHGLRAPAQFPYDLQLAGYEIDRVASHNPDGSRTQRYQLLHRLRSTTERWGLFAGERDGHA